MDSLEALIFDVDGTLADTERDGHRIAFNKAFEDADLDWVWDVELYGELLSTTGGKERIKRYIKEHEKKEILSTNLDEFVIELHNVKTKHYKMMMEDGIIPLRPGVKDLILDAKNNNIRLAIATTTTLENVTALLQNTLGLDSVSWFEHIGAGDVIPNKKPAPDIYNWVLDKMQLDPNHVIAFEDSENGVFSAHSANIKNIIVTTNDYTISHDFRSASLVLSSLSLEDHPTVDIKFLKNFFNKK
tara:strand:+ start:558 stop:1289 length:732 start_codon:yes stop_codon:yes gene_type:complete